MLAIEFTLKTTTKSFKVLHDKISICLESKISIYGSDRFIYAKILYAWTSSIPARTPMYVKKNVSTSDNFFFF